MKTQVISLNIMDDKKTLRDEIAIEAMKAIIISSAITDTGDADAGNPLNFFWNEVMNDYGNSDRSTLTEPAYEIADAMLKTRKTM